jgi:outer membrane receptor for ferrienterochelin and colicins
MKNDRRRFLILRLVVFLISSPVFAQQPRQSAGDLFELDLESLLNMKVTTASKFAEKLSDAPGVMSVVSRDELKRYGGITLREVLERVPSLAGSSAYFTDRSMVAARGDQTKIDGGHILILINGRPTREILEGGVISDLLESFPVNALDRIEVIKGPGSVLYGSNAFSAVINLITKRADETELVVTGLPGEQGAFSTSGLAMFSHGGLNVIAAAQTHKKPDWSTTYRFPFVDPLFPEASSVSVQDVKLRDRSRGGYLGVNYKGLSFMSSFTELSAPGFVRGTVGELQWRRGFGDLGYYVKASDNWDMNFNLTYTRTTLDVPDFPNIARDSNEVVAEWTNTFKATEKDRLSVGALYNHIQGQEQYFGLGFPITISEGKRSGGAFYAQDEHRLLDSVKLIGGFQANKIGTLDLDVVPRAGVIWNPTAHINVKTLYSKAFRAPSINETRLNHPGLEGNPDIIPEKVGTLDIGVGYQANRIQGSVNYFHSKHTDSIIVDHSRPRWKYMNLGEATFHGMELEGKYYFRKNLFVQGSMLYQENKDGNGTANVTPIANFGAKAGISYQTANGLTASLFDTYQGPIHGYASTMNPASRAYHLVSSQVRFDISRNLAFVAHAENLANRETWAPDWGGNSLDTLPINRGRTVYFGIEFSARKE